MRPFLLLFALFVLSAQMRAQLPVDREPHHTVVLENRYLRLIEGNIPAHDTTPAHVHSANSIVVFLSHSTFGIQLVGDTPVLTTVNPGDIKYSPYGDKPVNHIVWNQGPGPFHFFVVESRRKTVGAFSPMKVLPNKEFHFSPVSNARLVIAVSSAHFHFIPPRTSYDLRVADSYIVTEIQ